MQGYRSAASRLARTFRASRDVWKARAEQKQKKLRAMEIKVRDLQASRAQWKRPALGVNAHRKLAAVRAMGDEFPAAA